jgi:nitrate reductase gamma subunit
MDTPIADIFAFLVFPYIALSVFVLGHFYRYLKDPLHWNARSSQMLENRLLKYGSIVFHWGILLTLFGHAGGLLIPQRLYDAVGIDAQAHTRIAIYSGAVVGLAAVIGAALLLVRRLVRPRLLAQTSKNDFATLILLLWVGGTGLSNVFFGHFHVLDTIAPWIRGILILQPDPRLMADVPFGYRLHIFSAFVLLGFSPFSRLIHIWSAPVIYPFRRMLVFRKYAAAEALQPETGRES